MSDTGPIAPVRDTSAVGKNLSLVRLHIAAQKQTVSRGAELSKQESDPPIPQALSSAFATVKGSGHQVEIDCQQAERVGQCVRDHVAWQGAAAKDIQSTEQQTRDEI